MLLRSARGHHRIPSRLLAVAALLVGGCASVRGWTDDPPPSSYAGTRGVPYYAAGALPVHATPSDGAKIVGRLAPNARVTRTQVDRGWARIEADGVEGWVDAASLVTEPAPQAASPPDAVPATPPAPRRKRTRPASDDPS